MSQALSAMFAASDNVAEILAALFWSADQVESPRDAEHLVTLVLALAPLAGSRLESATEALGHVPVGLFDGREVRR